MLQIVLLVGKFVFLIILYVFIYRVVSSATRELRAAAATAERVRWPPGAGAPAPGGAGTGGKPGAVWTLVVQKSPCLAPGTVLAFPPGTCALAGRSLDADIYLEDTFVSAKHSLFQSTPAGLQVEDLRSTNGTQVNGKDISGPRLLTAGDVVQVGDTVFRVELR